MAKAIKKNVKKAQFGANLKNIHTGGPESDPGVLKAKANKAKSDSTLAAYKNKTDAQKAKKK
jgi:hypothetical protein